MILKQNLTMEEEKLSSRVCFLMQIISVGLLALLIQRGQKEIVRNAEEFKKIIKEERVEEELEREFEKTFQEGPDDD